MEEPDLSSQDLSGPDWNLNCNCHSGTQESIGTFLDKQLPEEVFPSCKIMSFDFQRVTCQNLLISSSLHTHFSWICTDQASDALRQDLECTQF